MNQFFRWLFEDGLNICTTIRKWTVSYGGWNSGRFESFWFKRNAYRFANSREESLVSVRNEITNKSESIKQMEAPIIYIYN